MLQIFRRAQPAGFRC